MEKALRYSLGRTQKRKGQPIFIGWPFVKTEN
jgi:hypothetical protein